MTSILVIEDEPGSRAMLAMALNGPGVRVHTAPNGEEGVRMAASQQYDWVVTDVKLPGMSGIEVSREIRAAQPDTRIVLMSAVVNEDEIEAARSIDAFWRKPFDPFALRKFLLNNERPAMRSPGLGAKHFYA